MPVIARSGKVSIILSINKAVLTWFAGTWEWQYAEPPSLEPWIPRDRSAGSHAALPRNPEQSQQDEERRDDTYYAKPPLGEASDISKGIEGLTLEPTPWAPRDVSTAETAELPSVSEDYRIDAKSQHYSEDQQNHPEYPEDRHKDQQRHHREDYGDRQYPEEQQYLEGQQPPETKFNRKDTRDLRSMKGKSRGVDEMPCPTCSMIFHRTSDLERHQKTVHLNDGARPYQCLVGGCTANVRSWTTADKLRLHEKTWHAGDSDTARSHTQQLLTAPPQPEPDLPRATFYGSASSGYVPPPSHSRIIIAEDRKSKYDELDASKSCNPIRILALRGLQGFTVHRSREFEFGRVFKVLWSEPIGSGGTEITFEAKYGEKAFHKIRRFIIMKQRNGHSVCLPILTYGYQGVLKYGVHPEDHAVVYSSKKDGPYLLDGEKGLMPNKPIRIEIRYASHKLDPHSRLNYAKVYTVEHNVKVLFIGRVARNYEQEVIRAFNQANPPIGPSLHCYRPDTPEHDFSHAEGATPSYPTMPMTTSSSWHPSGSPQSSSSGPGPQPYTHPDVYSSQPQTIYAGQQQQSENQMYDDGYDVD
jgi:uncharacterized C2H2 Zn-finger protein